MSLRNPQALSERVLTRLVIQGMASLAKTLQSLQAVSKRPFADCLSSKAHERASPSADKEASSNSRGSIPDSGHGTFGCKMSKSVRWRRSIGILQDLDASFSLIQASRPSN